MHLDTLGVINGCIDSLHQTRAYADFAWNNTYDIKAISDEAYDQLIFDWEKPLGGRDRVAACQALAKLIDPGDHGTNEELIFICKNAQNWGEFIKPYMESGKYGWYDIGHKLADPFPSNSWVGFLNRGWVQRALGTPLNFTSGSATIAAAFGGTADMVRGGALMLEDIAELLDDGKKVALVYGDRGNAAC